MSKKEFEIMRALSADPTLNVEEPSPLDYNLKDGAVASLERKFNRVHHVHFMGKGCRWR
jgi:hypothetical protein